MKNVCAEMRNLEQNPHFEKIYGQNQNYENTISAVGNLPCMLENCNFLSCLLFNPQHRCWDEIIQGRAYTTSIRKLPPQVAPMPLPSSIPSSFLILPSPCVLLSLSFHTLLLHPPEKNVNGVDAPKVSVLTSKLVLGGREDVAAAWLKLTPGAAVGWCEVSAPPRGGGGKTTSPGE